MIDHETQELLDSVASCAGSSFTQIAEIAHLDPKTDFRHADLSGVDFGSCNLSGYDFTCADLRFSVLDRAMVHGATFTLALTTGARFPSSFGSKNGDADFGRDALTSFQAKALENIEQALNLGSQSRVLSVAPPGSGKVLTLAALVARLIESGGSGKILLIAPSNAVKTQFVDLLRRAVRARVSESFDANQDIVIDTLTNLRRLIGPKTKSRPQQLFSHFTHVVVAEIDKFTVDVLVYLTEQEFPEGKVVAFSSTPSDVYSGEFRSSLAECFGDPIQNVGLEEMMVDAAAEASEIQIVSSGSYRGQSFQDIPAAAAIGVTRQIIEIITGRNESQAGIVVCPDPYTARAIAAGLENSLSNTEASKDQRLVRQLSDRKRSRASNLRFLGSKGSISVVDVDVFRSNTEACLKSAGFLVILSDLPGELLHKVAFPRWASERSTPLAVFAFLEKILDYQLNGRS